MTSPTEPNRSTADDVERAEPGLTGQDPAVVVDDAGSDPRALASDFDVVNDEKTGAYVAKAGDTEVAGLTYQAVGENRLVLLATSVFPEFRNRGIATRLIRHVLDDVRAQGKTVTITCPIVHTFIERNPAYADLIDPEHPGARRATPVMDQAFRLPRGEGEAATTGVEAEAAALDENNATLIAAMDQAGPDQVGSSWELDVINDTERSRWFAAIGPEAIAELSYRFVGGRVVLLTTWVDPAYRHHRVATELIARVLDEIRPTGKKITVICPVVGEFIARNPHYRDLIDKVHPGSGAYPQHRRAAEADDQ
ncbi:GNAT family N-acetyltransferase [Streptomyces sp. Ag109_O5-1]|uniref:GNAT family N-acetyltransferase n=1 Tax=Streptomyces sp. Ag109_O5-1 TaxID=1938851 RepID=UPI001C842D5C|nr:GNAT family N-acetyltransferase [Streptomyces sp. Ag109_O5-1]